MMDQCEVITHDLKYNAFNVSLYVQPSEGLSFKLWQAAKVLSDYLEEHVGIVVGKRIVELGSGVGLVGIVAARLGAKAVVLTDLPKVIEIIQRNIQHNNVTENATAVPCCWGEETPAHLRKPDLILASDVVYLEECFEPLVKTLVELTGEETVILMGYERRRKIEKRFFNRAKKNILLWRLYIA